MKILLFGGGKTVYFLAREFSAKGHHTTVITKDPDEARRFAHQLNSVVVHGDGSSPMILEDAGVREVDVLLALTTADQDNLIACQVAQRMFGVSRTFALVNDPENEDVFHELGVTVAFSATHVVARMIEEQADIDEIINLFPVAGGRVQVTEVSLRSHAPSVGKTLLDLDLPQESLIATIIRGEDVIIPGGRTDLREGDRLLVVTEPQVYDQVMMILTGSDG
ncbi:MAG: TrkA family potassium uptake protein [Anaerolineales bacterium]|nr:TrkA family potassium uptake protein [Anaerolineales bacterium]